MSRKTPLPGLPGAPRHKPRCTARAFAPKTHKSDHSKNLIYHTHRTLAAPQSRLGSPENQGAPSTTPTLMNPKMSCLAAPRRIPRSIERARARAAPSRFPSRKENRRATNKSRHYYDYRGCARTLESPSASGKLALLKCLIWPLPLARYSRSALGEKASIRARRPRVSLQSAIYTLFCGQTRHNGEGRSHTRPFFRDAYI